MTFLKSTFRRWALAYASPSGRTGELFLQNLQQIQARTDKLFLYVLIIQYPAAIAVALLWSPLAWAGSTSTIHFHVWLAVVFGGILTSLPVYLIRTFPAESLTRQVTAVAQMLMGGLLIHLSGGRIETHFHVFGSLAFLAFYRDLRVLATATVVVSADHLLRGVVAPESIYGSGLVSANGWRFLEHAFWVIFEDIFLAMACVQGRVQLREMASQQAQLEKLNETIEAAVCIRTRELSLKTEELAAARDAAMESTRLKSQFLANVSHEIRTPMNGVLGMTSLLLETELSSDQRDCAATVQRSAEGLLTIINDILDFSKVEAGKLVLERAAFLLPNEIDHVIRLLSEAAERKQLEFLWDIDPEVPPVLLGDAGRLRQVLVNLIGNAIKFTEQGRVGLRAVIVKRDGQRVRTRFEVSDTGIGISQHARTRLFEAFVQVDGSTSRRHEGTGLGLAIAKQLVELMGGQMGFDSMPGVGSTFWFEIPFDVLSESEQATCVAANALSGLRLLVVGDNATDRDILMQAARSWGMLAEQASDQTEALKTLETAFRDGRPFDIATIRLRACESANLQFADSIRRNEHLQSTQLLMLPHSRQTWSRSSLNHTAIAPPSMNVVRPEHLFFLIAKSCGRSTASQASNIFSDGKISSLQNSLSVLVAEDNLVNQRVLTRMLERLGHRYNVVADGEAAIEAMKASYYDIVLMDCQMPRVDGFEATREIRRLPSPAAQTPIIAVTANAMSGDRERCLAAGMTAYLAKPVRLGELAEALDKQRKELATVA